MPSGAISVWSTADKVGAAILRSKRYMPESLGRQLDAFLTPTNLAIVGGTLAIWAGSHFFGVGEVVDVALLLVGAFTIGWSITGVVRDLVAFGTGVVVAQTDQDLDRAARLFASAIVAAGITAVFAILLHRSAASLQATRGSTIGDVLTVRRPGLSLVEPNPGGPDLFRTPTVTGKPTMPAGRGATTAFGDVEYSTAGSATDQQLVRLHELVHSFLSPRLSFLRTFRARPAMSAYSRSAIMQYLEEISPRRSPNCGSTDCRASLPGFAFRWRTAT
jgi:hypothetical protein